MDARAIDRVHKLVLVLNTLIHSQTDHDHEVPFQRASMSHPTRCSNTSTIDREVLRNHEPDALLPAGDIVAVAGTDTVLAVEPPTVAAFCLLAASFNNGSSFPCL